MPCGICGRGIAISLTPAGEVAIPTEPFTREHASCIAALLAETETHESRRKRLLREALHRAHTGPHGLLRAMSESEIAYLLGPVLDALEDAEERHAAQPSAISRRRATG